MPYNPLPIILAFAGAYLLIKVRFFYILHPVRSFGSAIRALSDKKSLTSFMLALAGTLGVGNVLGVAMGIIVGGAGSVFWLLLSAIPASVLKYSEVVLASDGDRGRGGMHCFLRERFPVAGRSLSAIYATACLLLSLFMGAALQVKSVAALISPFGADTLIVAAVAVFVVLLSVVRGAEAVGKITLIVIPLTTMIYIFLTISIIASSYERIPDVVSMIIGDAFSPRAGAGGACGFLTSMALREGFARGMLSNEAGAGTSTMAHACGGERSSRVRGLLGVLEVFFDTVLLCGLTALAILTAVPDPWAYDNGMELVLSSVRLGIGGEYAPLLVLSVISFAYSTVICWYYYGSECMRFAFGGRYGGAFTLLFLTFVFVGVFISEWILVLVADVLLLIMTALTVPTLIKSSDRIVELSELLKTK